MGTGGARVDGLGVRDAVLADVVEAGDQRGGNLAHHEEGRRVVGVTDREVAVAVEHAVVVEDVQGVDVGGEQGGDVCGDHFGMR